MRKSWELYKQLHKDIYRDDAGKEAELRRAIDIMTYTESMINEALASALKEHDTDRSIYEVLAYIGKSTGSDRAYLFESRGDYAENTYEWCNEGVTAEKDNLSNVPWEDMKLWSETFEKGENVIIPNVDEIKESNPVVYGYLVPQNIHSLVVSPLMYNGKILGFYGVDNPPGEILSYVSDMSWIVSHFLLAMIKQREMVKHLEQLSYYDQLTGLRNRHALFDNLSRGNVKENVGVIYCDVMGLKKVNDLQGHEAGDELLIRASECLKKCFRVKDTYRLGGDEFLVMCAGIDKADFGRRIEKIRIDMKENNAMMALGSVWCETLEDADAIIAKADDLMYKEKQEYYKNNLR